MNSSITKKVSAVTTMAVFGAVYALHGEVVNLTQGSTTGYELTDGNTYIIQNSVEFSNSTAGGSGMSVADGATVVIYIPKDVTLTAIGANGSGQIGGGAGIRVPETSTLVITGEGTVNATGGNAGDGENGANGSKGGAITCAYGNYPKTLGGSGLGYGPAGKGNSGAGGNGGAGGGGAGAGIGTEGGLGGEGGDSGASRVISSIVNLNGFVGNGSNGGNGGNGSVGADMGVCYILGRMSLSALGGAAGVCGGAGSKADWTLKAYDRSSGNDYYFATCGGGGGGGGGAGSAAVCAIGGGGAAGGGGGGGGSGANTAENDTHYERSPLTNANGGGGLGGGSSSNVGASGAAKGKTCGGSWYNAQASYYYGGEGGAGGAAGYEGGAGFLYVSPTAIVNVEREKLMASTHSAAQYKITFDANGGQLVSSVDSLTATLGCELPDCILAPTRNGFAFDGWRSATGEEYYGASGTKNISSYPIPCDVVLYAHWKAVGHTSTTPIPVPYSYFDENCPTLLSAYGGDYEAVAHSTAMNGCNKVWECYVSGISPTNEDSRFTAIIKIGADGKPILSWKPPLNGETPDGSGIREGVRSYRVYGKRNLDDVAEEWTPVVEGDEREYRFFKVGVTMP